MMQEHLNSRAFQAAFSKARLQKYKDSLHLPVIDGASPVKREVLTIAGKTVFLGTEKDMQDIVEAFAKVAKNIDKLT